MPIILFDSSDNFSYANYVYEAPSLVKKILGIFTWSSLLLLIPLATIGFFSEASLPGQTLYPLKRGIENIVLGLDSFDKKTQAVYDVYLTDRRFSETEKLLTDSPIMLDTSQVQDFTSQIQSARDTINAIADAQDRKALRQKLIQNIGDYRNQLAILQTQNPSAPVTSQTVSPTPVQNPVSVPTNQNSQVGQIQQQLQNLQDQIQQDQNNNVNTQSPTPTDTPIPKPTPTPIPTKIPTPTLTPSPTSTPIPSPTPTPTPTPTPDFYHSNNGNGNSYGNGNSKFNFSNGYPTPTSNFDQSSTGSAATQ